MYVEPFSLDYLRCTYLHLHHFISNSYKINKFTSALLKIIFVIVLFSQLTVVQKAE